MALINLVVIVLLSGPALLVLKDYDQQLQTGKTPVFNRKCFPFLHQTIDNDVWTSGPDEPDDPDESDCSTSPETAAPETAAPETASPKAADDTDQLPDRS